MHESHEEYMKRRLREEQGNKIFESPDNGKTVYERNFGSTERSKVKEWISSFVEDPGDLEIKVTETPNYKYNEDALIKEFKAYIDAT